MYVGILRPAIVLFPQCVVHHLKKQMKLAVVVDLQDSLHVNHLDQSAIVILA